MAAVRCPKCGTINTEGVGSFPLCRRCREHLLKCRYCTHFDRAVLDCVHPRLRDGSHINDPDLYAACPQHTTRLRVGAGGRFAALLTSPMVLTALALAVVLAIAGYTFAHFYNPSDEVLPEQVFMTATLHPAQASVGHVVWIKVDITNRARVTVKHLTLLVGRDFMAQFSPVELLPAPQAAALDPVWQHLDFGALGPGAGLTVRYTFEATEPGTFPLRLQLRSEGGMLHGGTRLDVLISE